MPNLQFFLQDFNPGKFIVYLCLLSFVTLISLRLDETIQISYWLAFLPLWIWKSIAIVGAVVGTSAWFRRSSLRADVESYIHFKAMLLSLSIQLLLLLFELLACDKLESGRHIWVLVFLPLLSASVLCIAVCVWAVKHGRPFEMEMFGAVNLLQFVFIALQLDGFIAWKWEVVFIPLWITFCLSLVGVLYSVILAAVLIRSTDISSDQRRASAHAALSYAFLVIPGLMSQVFLANKLDGEIEVPFFIVCIPVLISLATQVVRSFNSRGGNIWWFGMRKDFCAFFLETFPALREYGNISYRFARQVGNPTSAERASLSSGNHGESPNNEKRKKQYKHEVRTVVPVVHIDVPD
nr:EOG090X087A [Eulimnadia texana]